MSHAVVLGGGGPVGVGWQSGLVVGLAAAGIRLADAELIVGTSAGSVVGAELALGMDVQAGLALAADPMPVAQDAATGMAALLAATATSVINNESVDEIRRTAGRVAVDSPTADEGVFVERFAAVADVPWPRAFICTAVDTETGQLQVWDARTGVPLSLAIASSCAVPGIFPAITIGGRRYMDGGMRTALNADLAEGHERVLALSCMALSLPDGFTDPLTDALNALQAAELDYLGSTGSKVGVIAPGEEFLEISGWGLHLMDASRVLPAFEAGRRQAEAEATRIGPLWSD
jgi:NTE family protein